MIAAGGPLKTTAHGCHAQALIHQSTIDEIRRGGDSRRRSHARVLIKVLSADTARAPGTWRGHNPALLRRALAHDRALPAQPNRVRLLAARCLTYLLRPLWPTG